MKFIRYSKFRGFDVSSVDLGNLMDSLSNQMLDSGFHEDYWWTRQKNKPDDSLDALRQAILQALLENDVLSEQDVEQILAQRRPVLVQEAGCRRDEACERVGAGLL